MSNPGPNVTTTAISNDVMEANPTGAASGDGKYIGLASTSLIGFWGKTPTARPASSGNASNPSAGSTTAVKIESTFDGGSGTAYTIGDLVVILKAAGILAP